MGYYLVKINERSFTLKMMTHQTIASGVMDYLIAMQNSIGARTTFNNLRNGNYYFQENDPSLDGYQSPDSLVKPMVDDWYADNVSGTAYEQYVQPVVLNNPTLQTMLDAGWLSNISGNVSTTVWPQVTMGSEFNTVVGGSTKQAFLMGAADVTANNGTSTLTANALAHRDKLTVNGVSTSWLRSPGTSYESAVRLYSGGTTTYFSTVNAPLAVVPALVVTGIEIPTVEVNAITGNSTDGYTVTGVGSDFAATVSITDSSGNVLGTGNVNSDGSYSVPISGTVGPNAQINVTASDILGNVSDPASGTTPADATAIINLQPSRLIEGDEWNPASNFVSATDKNGNPVDFTKITVTGNVDTTTPGTYEVTYSYGDVDSKATITVSKVEGNTPGPDPINPFPVDPNEGTDEVPRDTTLPDSGNDSSVIPKNKSTRETNNSSKGNNNLPALNAKQSSLSFTGLLLLLGGILTTLGVKILTRKKR